MNKKHHTAYMHSCVKACKTLASACGQNNFQDGTNFNSRKSFWALQNLTISKRILIFLLPFVMNLLYVNDLISRSYGSISLKVSFPELTVKNCPFENHNCLKYTTNANTIMLHSDCVINPRQYSQTNLARSTKDLRLVNALQFEM